MNAQKTSAAEKWNSAALIFTSVWSLLDGTFKIRFQLGIFFLFLEIVQHGKSGGNNGNGSGDAADNGEHLVQTLHDKPSFPVRQHSERDRTLSHFGRFWLPLSYPSFGEKSNVFVPCHTKFTYIIDSIISNSMLLCATIVFLVNEFTNIFFREPIISLFLLLHTQSVCVIIAAFLCMQFG